MAFETFEKPKYLNFFDKINQNFLSMFDTNKKKYTIFKHDSKFIKI